jgi:hypothetical protein
MAVRTSLDGEPDKPRRHRRGHGDGGVHQRADGRWEARLDLPDGKTRTEVRDKLKEPQRKLDEGIDLDAGRLTVAAFLGKWLASGVQPSVKTKTYEGCESIVRVRVAPRLGREVLGKLTPLDLQSLYSDL